jgi:hypothetical protein
MNRQPSKFASQKAKKRDYQNNREKAMKKSNMNQKTRRTCGQLKTADFVENI